MTKGERIALFGVFSIETGRLMGDALTFILRHL
jgi:hypothetical protein